MIRSLIENVAHLFIGQVSRTIRVYKKIDLTYPIYPDHDEKCLKECLENLRDKGIDIE